MEIGQIVTGHVNEFLNLNKDLAESRIHICKKCPLYSPKLGGLCNNRLWYNTKTNEVSTEKKDGFKNGCGCRLKAKTTISASSCPIGKW